MCYFFNTVDLLASRPKGLFGRDYMNIKTFFLKSDFIFTTVIFELLFRLCICCLCAIHLKSAIYYKLDVFRITVLEKYLLKHVNSIVALNCVILYFIIMSKTVYCRTFYLLMRVKMPKPRPYDFTDELIIFFRICAVLKISVELHVLYVLDVTFSAALEAFPLLLTLNLKSHTKLGVYTKFVFLVLGP